jgi:hypothetical protein
MQENTLAIDVAKMKVYKSIDYLEHRNLSGINKAGETKNLYVSDYTGSTVLYCLFFSNSLPHLITP